MSTAAEFLEMSSAELLRRINSISTASDLPPFVPCLQDAPNSPLTPAAKDQILREHAMRRGRVACKACSTPEEREAALEQIDQELLAAVQQANPDLYRRRWKE